MALAFGEYSMTNNYRDNPFTLTYAGAIMEGQGILEQEQGYG